MRCKLGFDTLEFRQNINDISEHDYGDFMRAANVFLNSFIENLQILSDKNINLRLSKIKNYLQYTPNWDVDSTRILMAEDTKYLDELLLGHNQDWESGIGTKTNTQLSPMMGILPGLRAFLTRNKLSDPHRFLKFN
jgi:hypothetical protein